MSEDKHHGIAVRILRWFEGERSGPFEMELNPTDRCNQKCITCYCRGKSHYEADRELPDEVYRTLATELPRLGVRQVQIVGGGEALIRGELVVEMMVAIKEAGGGGFLNTNGTLFREEWIRKLVEIEWDEITMSLDGPNPEINDTLRGLKGSFEKTVRAIREFTRLKKAMNRTRPVINVSPVLSNRNCSRIEEMARLVVDIGADTLTYQPLLVPNSDEGKLLMVSEENKQRYLRELEPVKKWMESQGVSTNLDEFSEQVIDHSNEMGEVLADDVEKIALDDPILKIPCYLPWSFIKICAHGSVTPCPMMPSDAIDMHLGDRPLEEIWLSAPFEEVREHLASGELLSYCRNCCGINVFHTQIIREKVMELKGR